MSANKHTGEKSRPGQEASETSQSPAWSPPTRHHSTCAPIVKEKIGEFIEITVHSLMEGVEEVKILVSPNCKVSELKINVSEATDVLPEKMLLLYNHVELKNDNVPISTYGIMEDCEITMSLRMSTGSRTTRSSNAVLYVPPSFPEGSVNDLRNKIKSMTSIRQRTSKVSRVLRKITTQNNKKHSEWSAEKQREHEVTRKKMKSLLKRQRKRILSDDSTGSQGSVISRSASTTRGSSCEVMASDESNRRPRTNKNSERSLKQMEDESRTTVTVIELQTFFEPPETILELEQKKQSMCLPPSNEKELQDVKAQREEFLKTVCQVCLTKLKPSEQQMRCACQYVFCKKHRRPDRHLCLIDHKQRGRFKLHAENPKIDDKRRRKLKI
nr:Ubiquitin and Zinc finger domain containing protein [Haemonchus contortus]